METATGLMSRLSEAGLTGSSVRNSSIARFAFPISPDGVRKHFVFLAHVYVFQYRLYPQMDLRYIFYMLYMR